MTRNAEVVNYKNREVSRAEIASEPATDRDEKLTRELCRNDRIDPERQRRRRAAVVERLADAVRTSGARLLDYSADPSHNQSVFTLAGDAPAVAAAILALFTEAVAAIDLRTHAGEHPRIGAVDVRAVRTARGVDDGRVCSARKAGWGDSGQPL